MSCVVLDIVSKGQGTVGTGEMSHPWGNQGRTSCKKQRFNYKECLWGSRKMRTEGGCPLSLTTGQLLVILSKPVEMEWQEGEWKRPKSEQVSMEVTGILMTLFYYRVKGSYFLHLLSCKLFKALVLVVGPQAEQIGLLWGK